MDNFFKKAEERLDEKAVELSTQMGEMASTNDPELVSDPLFKQIMDMLASKIVQIMTLKIRVRREDEED